MTTSANAAAITEDTVRALSASQNEPSWLLERRLTALRAYNAMSMPDPLEEEWRRTDISKLDLAGLVAAPAGTGAELPADVASSEGYAAGLIQRDGAASVEASSLPAGVVFTDLATAARDHAALVEANLHGLVHPTEWKLAALQAAVWQGGAFLYLPRGVELELPLHQVVSLSGGLAAPHLLVIADEASSLTLVQDLYSPDGAAGLVSGAVEIYARPNARVRYVEVQRLGRETWNFSTVRAHLEQGADLTAALVGLGSRLTKTKLEVSLEGEGARTELLGLSLGRESQHFDYVTLQDHIAPHTESDLMFKAALDDRASEVWTGTVRIRKGAAQSAANQTSRNLLLSDKAKAAPIPVLEIEAYDVLRCSHGATAGPLDEEQRFYLESRGIPSAEAEHLLIEAFFHEVIDRIPAPAIGESLAQALLDKYEAGR